MLSCKDFFLDYNKKLSEVLKNYHYDEIEKITKFLETSIKTKKKIFVCGNGGSASIANHFLCDFNKGIKISSSKHITESVGFLNPKVAGVVSTNPAYLMNSTTEGVAIALKGRIPCKVEGPVNKGDLLVSSMTPGVATALAQDSAMPSSICIIGKSIEANSDSGIKLIEIAV